MKNKEGKLQVTTEGREIRGGVSQKPSSEKPSLTPPSQKPKSTDK